MTPVQKSQHIFTQKYNKQPELTVYAPGRVNIIGEHTDYNDGFVMPLCDQLWYSHCGIKTG